MGEACKKSEPERSAGEVESGRQQRAGRDPRESGPTGSGKESAQRIPRAQPAPDAGAERRCRRPGGAGLVCGEISDLAISSRRGRRIPPRSRAISRPMAPATAVVTVSGRCLCDHFRHGHGLASRERPGLGGGQWRCGRRCGGRRFIAARKGGQNPALGFGHGWRGCCEGRTPPRRRGVRRRIPDPTGSSYTPATGRPPFSGDAGRP